MNYIILGIQEIIDYFYFFTNMPSIYDFFNELLEFGQDLGIFLFMATTRYDTIEENFKSTLFKHTIFINSNNLLHLFVEKEQVWSIVNFIKKNLSLIKNITLKNKLLKLSKELKNQEEYKLLKEIVFHINKTNELNLKELRLMSIRAYRKSKLLYAKLEELNYISKTKVDYIYSLNKKIEDYDSIMKE